MMDKCFFYKYEKNTDNAILTVIITYRTNIYYDMFERIKYRKKYDKNISNKISFLIVDDGSSTTDSDTAKEICKQNNFNYLYIDSQDKPFSPSRSRNIGAQYANTKYIVHEDIDLCPYNGYYNTLLQEIEDSDLINNNDDFITVPVAYLTDIASQEYLKNPIEKRKEFLNDLMHGKTDWYEFFMPASSVIIIARHYYLSIGGYNENFRGWGLEDLEFAFRITRLAKKFHTPHDYKKLITTNFSRQFDYCGWRAQFRLHGELFNRKGIILFHIKHPIDRTWRNKNKHSNNEKLFQQCIELFETKGHYLPCLPDIHQGRSLIFGKGCFVYSRYLRPIWGDIHIQPYEHFNDVNVLDYIKENNISRVVFTNPYANDARIKIYNIIRKANIQYFVVERGALRDSIYIDHTGFCCESHLYHEKYWNHELSKEEKEYVYRYIREEKDCDNSLERQNSRIERRLLMDKLNIPSGKKILFIPLQSRSDTTTTLFAGDIGSYDNFIQLVNDVAHNISSEWIVLVKKHPLSDVDEEIKGVTFVNEINIKDLIEISDYILLMNSGVGLLALLWNRPVLYTSSAFYANEKLNIKVHSYEDVINALNSGFLPDKEVCLRFIHYLIHDFYSFGKMKTYEKKYTDNARLTITKDIEYYNINMNASNIFCKDTDKVCMNFKSPLYDRFIFSISLRKNSSSEQNKINNHSKVRRLFLKLLNNPYKFFNDSKKFNFLKRFFKKR